MKIKYIFIAVLLAMFTRCEVNGPTLPSETIDQIPVIDIFMHKQTYLTLLSNRLRNFEVTCKLHYKSRVYDAEVRGSGAGSRYHPKWSFKIRLDDGELIEGLNAFTLSAQIFDKTLTKTNLALAMYAQDGDETTGFEKGFPVFKCRHIFLRINGKEIGLYPIIEAVDEDFLEKRNIQRCEIIKAGFESSFSFESDNHPEKNFNKKIPDDGNLESLKEMIYARDTCAVENLLDGFGKFLDIENYLRYHAITTLLNNSDAFNNNFILIKQTPSGPFRIIPWDFDKCFDYERPQGLYGKNELIEKLFQSDTIVEMYKKEIRFQLDNYFREERLFPIIDSVTAKIENAYNADMYLGKDKVYSLGEEAAKLKEYISERIKFMSENIDTLKAF